MPRLPTYRNLFGRPRPRAVASRSATRWIEAIRRRVVRDIELLSSTEMLNRAAALRQRISQGEPPTSAAVVVESFALTAESVRRTTGKRYFDVQLSGGLALAGGAIAEIQTGEGKTIVAALPASLHAWAGSGVHVATTNDYLSRRDHDELRPAYEMLGFTVGLIQSQAPDFEKRRAYACDITYAPGYEFGFDFLRDRLTMRSEFREPLGARHLQRLRGQHLAKRPLLQRGHAFAVVDEADGVLIDDATTPLILSGTSELASTAPDLYRYVNRMVQELVPGDDYALNRPQQHVELTTAGWARIHERFNGRPHGQLARPWSQVVEQALRARFLLTRDIDYVVRDGKVSIVDQNTGRVFDERTWRAGLHQAVEAKEGVEISDEKETQARITRQRFSLAYRGICGMTGTGQEAEAEFREFYNLPVVTVPTNQPCIRRQLPDRGWISVEAKNCALASEIALRQAAGQPVLVGTRSIRGSRRLSRVLAARGIEHQVLNGVQDEAEAGIIARAGQSGTVTVATNMAGRGTDIRINEVARQTGGLHVVATEHHESRRVDRQLSGRAGRQGDPGSVQFWISPEDTLLNNASIGVDQFGHSDAVGELLRVPAAAIRRAQAKYELEARQRRRQLVEQDGWLESVQDSLARFA